MSIVSFFGNNQNVIAVNIVIWVNFYNFEVAYTDVLPESLWNHVIPVFINLPLKIYVLSDFASDIDFLYLWIWGIYVLDVFHVKLCAFTDYFLKFAEINLIHEGIELLIYKICCNCK